jgi:hypothetical protein
MPPLRAPPTPPKPAAAAPTTHTPTPHRPTAPPKPPQGLLALCLLPGIFFFSRRCRLRYDAAVESMPLWLAHAAPRTRVDPQVRVWQGRLGAWTRRHHAARRGGRGPSSCWARRVVAAAHPPTSPARARTVAGLHRARAAPWRARLVVRERQGLGALGRAHVRGVRPCPGPRLPWASWRLQHTPAAGRAAAPATPRIAIGCSLARVCRLGLQQRGGAQRSPSKRPLLLIMRDASRAPARGAPTLPL